MPGVNIDIQLDVTEHLGSFIDWMGDTAEAREAAVNETVVRLIEEGGTFLPYTESNPSQNNIEGLLANGERYYVIDRDGDGLFDVIAQQHGSMWSYTTGESTIFNQAPPTLSIWPPCLGARTTCRV